MRILDIVPDPRRRLLRPAALAALALAALACKSSAPTGADTASTPAPTPADTAVPASPPPAPADTAPPDPVPEPPPEPLGACETAKQAYELVRGSIDRCASDGDCAEYWPGHCPFGPFYFDSAADLAPLELAAQGIHTACGDLRCAKPGRLGVGHCENGKCVRGRTLPSNDSCWDYELTWAENGINVQGTAFAAFQGLTPRLGFGVPAAGKLRLAVEWIGGCPDCRLEVSVGNSEMGSLADLTWTPSGDTAIAELPVAPGLLYFLGRSASPDRLFRLTVTLERSDGAPAAASRHGITFPRMCED